MLYLFKRLVKFHQWLAICLALSCIVSASAVSPQSATAQSTVFSLTPALKELKVDPGWQGSFDITITNHSTDSQAVKVYARNFSANGVDGEVTFSDNNTISYAAADWLLLSAHDLVLPADGQETVTVQALVPPQAEPGGKYAAIMFEQILPPGNSLGRDSKVNVATRMAALIYFTVSGDIVESGQILGANTADQKCSAVVCGFSVPSFLDKGPVPFQFLFSNTGNIHVRPKGTITITQFGRQVAKINVEDRGVLPNSQRRFTTTWDRSLLIGPYQATLDVAYGSKNYHLTAIATFWAFPWQAALIVALILVIAAALLLSRKYFGLKRLTAKKSSSSHG